MTLPGLPLANQPGAPLAVDPRGAPACDVDDDGCITCGDVAVVLTVVSVDGGDAVCRDDAGAQEVVAVDLVDPVSPGDRVLVHARVAIERLQD
jgi:hydrogenase expression/formation protein HypC